MIKRGNVLDEYLARNFYCTMGTKNCSENCMYVCMSPVWIKRALRANCPFILLCCLVYVSKEFIFFITHLLRLHGISMCPSYVISYKVKVFCIQVFHYYIYIWLGLVRNQAFHLGDWNFLHVLLLLPIIINLSSGSKIVKIKNSSNCTNYISVEYSVFSK